MKPLNNKRLSFRLVMLSSHLSGIFRDKRRSKIQQPKKYADTRSGFGLHNRNHKCGNADYRGLRGNYPGGSRNRCDFDRHHPWHSLVQAHCFEVIRWRHAFPAAIFFLVASGSAFGQTTEIEIEATQYAEIVELVELQTQTLVAHIVGGFLGIAAVIGIRSIIE